jgi:hypothetical protein
MKSSIPATEIAIGRPAGVGRQEAKGGTITVLRRLDAAIGHAEPF